MLFRARTTSAKAEVVHCSHDIPISRILFRFRPILSIDLAKLGFAKLRSYDLAVTYIFMYHICAHQVVGRTQPQLFQLELGSQESPNTAIFDRMGSR